MKQAFFKMQGAGNDYIFIDALHTPPPSNPKHLAVMLSHRHFGIGGDGIVLILPSQKANAKMQMFNSDGSEGAMCGNAIRCIGLYLFTHCHSKSQPLTVETKSGIKTLIWEESNGALGNVIVDMGEAIPMVTPKKGVPFCVKQNNLIAYPISMGNPHLVCFCPPHVALSPKDLQESAEKMPCFQGGVNTEMAWVRDKQSADVRVWERGSGETLSCGTGACAVAAVGMSLNVFDPKEPVSLCFPGGMLTVTQDKNRHFWLGGETKFVFSGEIAFETAM